MKILFVEPHESSLFSFRKELLDTLIRDGHDVVLCIQSTEKIVNEYSKVLKIIDVPMNLKDKGIRTNLKLKHKYKRIIREEKPDLILSYKIKPNIYCGLYAKKIPMIANITGLGNMFKSDGLLSRLGVFLYRKSFKNIEYVFFQNSDGLDFFKSNKIRINNYRIIPGSGVNLSRYSPAPLINDGVIKFLFASRALEEKGFNLLTKAIPLVIARHKNVHFNFLSAEESVSSDKFFLSIYEQYKNFISILDRVEDMSNIYSNNSFLVSPSYYREGISNVLLESLACGRPIITTKDNPGCKEVLVEGVNGFGVLSKDLNSLVHSLSVASELSAQEIEKMGLMGRQFVEKNFDRQIVINNYLEIIDIIRRRQHNINNS